MYFSFVFFSAFREGKTLQNQQTKDPLPKPPCRAYVTLPKAWKARNKEWKFMEGGEIEEFLQIKVCREFPQPKFNPHPNSHPIPPDVGSLLNKKMGTTTLNCSYYVIFFLEFFGFMFVCPTDTRTSRKPPPRRNASQIFFWNHLFGFSERVSAWTNNTW